MLTFVFVGQDEQEKMTLSGTFRLFRLPNLCLIVCFFLAGEHLFLAPLRSKVNIVPTLSTLDYSLYILAVCLVTLFGYWLNDAFDQEADRINRPERALSNGSMSKGQVVSYSIWALLLGGLTSVYLALANNRLEWLWLYPFITLVLWIYSKYSKPMGFWGNIIVSLLIGFLPGMIILPELDTLLLYTDRYPMATNALMKAGLCFVALVFLSNLTREVIKDLEDVDGDRRQNGQSLAIKFGEQKVKTVINVLLVLILSMQWLLLVFFGFGPYTISIGILMSLLLVGLLILSLQPIQQNGLRMLSNGMKLVMFAGIFQLFFFSDLI